MNIQVPLEVRNAASRVVDEYNRLDRNYRAAHVDWQIKMTVSSAIRRDDAMERRDALTDAYLVAHFVIGIREAVSH